MSFKVFKFWFYTILIFMILFFYTRSINLFGNNFYKNIKTVDNPKKIDVLVNKNNKLDKFYKPNDLVKLDLKYANKDKYLRKEAAKSFSKLSQDAKNLGYSIIAVSTYRSYFYQQELFNYYTKSLGYKKAIKASAKPGHSEHQTGLAVDVEGSNSNYNTFDKSKEFNWIKDNAHKYGFILRYPSGKENITGFKYEPWHYRYVGINLATYLYKNNLTLEEYYKKKHIK